MHIGKIMFVAICSRYPFYIGYFDKTNGSGKRYLVCPSSSSGARDMKISDFSRWRMAAMLDLAMRNIPNVENNHLGVFVIPILVRNDTLFVFLVHLGARDMKLLIFKMANGGHLAFSHKKGTKTQK